MADEEPIKKSEETAVEGNTKGGSKKKPILLVGVFLLTFILAGAGNFIYLKMTYVPPEPPPPEEQPQEHKESGPILTIDLSDKPAPEENTALAEVTIDSTQQAIKDSVTREDSIKTVIQELRASLKASDSLLAKTIEKLDIVKQQLKLQNAQEDSAQQKRTAKLAKIVEDMPPKEAAQMLVPLSDEMILDILLRLKQRQAAKIMAEFSAQRSAKLSEVILKPLVRG